MSAIGNPGINPRRQRLMPNGLVQPPLDRAGGSRPRSREPCEGHGAEMSARGAAGVGVCSIKSRQSVGLFLHGEEPSRLPCLELQAG